MTTSAAPGAVTRRRALLANVAIVAACALVYELICGTIASYLLGNAVLQFSIVLGTYVSAMGVGAWLSRRFEPKARQRYIHAELLLAAVGGASVPMLLFAFAAHAPLRPILYATVFVIGTIVGLELPLLVCILKGDESFKDLVARALALDYLGALVASILFPLVFVPSLGLIRTSLLVGIVNAVVAISATYLVRIPRPYITRLVGVSILGGLIFAFARSAEWARVLTD
jgi:spermidine synthase